MFDTGDDLPLLESGELTQLMVVQALDKFDAKVGLFEAKEKTWLPVFERPLDAVVGKEGLIEARLKTEGDLKTPVGLYGLKQAFGTALCKVGLDFIHLSPDDKWVDDVESADYNQLIRGDCDARSFEHMYRDTYRLGAIIDYNMNPVKPGRGSAIFFHVWESPITPTAGCVAMSYQNVYQILHWLDQSKNPHILIKP